jgi:hypothetical protein
MSTNPRRNPDTSFRRIGDEGGLVVLPGRAEVKVLNPAAIQIFSMLDGKHTAEEIATTVAAEFEVSYENALADLKAFLAELSEHGMLAVEAEA